MKTPEKIKKGLEYCGSRSYCDSDCEYYDSTDSWGCPLQIDAFAYIQQLESDNESKQKHIDELESSLAQVEREMDAAIVDLSDRCQKCKHIACDDEDEDSPCKDCMQRKGGVPFGPMIRTHFEWRGVCPENSP